MDKIQLNAAIIGGGIIGLMTAFELKRKFPEWEIALLEAAPYLGDHSTGRNSGVLHAGLYYPTNSNKHLLCLEGIQLWKKELCPQFGIDFLECGKILFAKNENEISGLEDIWKKAHENQVPNLSRVEESELKEINQHVHATSAFFSKGTGILDVSDALKKFADAFESLGGMIARECKVLNIERESTYKISTRQFEISSEILINAAGFFGPELRKMLGLNDLRSLLVKGNYISTSQKLDYKYLYYPVPPKDLKGLGVHSTLDLEGKIKFGPNTEDVNGIDYSDTQTALNSMRPEILSTFKNIDESKLYWDYAGIRSKLMNSRTGKLETDFWIKSPLPSYVECLGIESPGLTSAPAIARYILKNLLC